MRLSRRIIIAAALVLALFAAQGCSKPEPEAPIDPSATAIAGAPAMPDWLAKADPLIKTEYIWAAAHLKELQYIPCYCGCQHDGHTDNFACYYDRDGNGAITDYDGMAVS